MTPDFSLLYIPRVFYPLSCPWSWKFQCISRYKLDNLKFLRSLLNTILMNSNKLSLVTTVCLFDVDIAHNNTHVFFSSDILCAIYNNTLFSWSFPALCSLFSKIINTFASYCKFYLKNIRFMRTFFIAHLTWKLKLDQKLRIIL